MSSLKRDSTARLVKSEVDISCQSKFREKNEWYRKSKPGAEGDKEDVKIISETEDSS